MNRIPSSLLALGLVVGTTSHAGNSTSGGGFAYGDQLNPWFLENVRNVNYCILVDEEHFHASRAVISRSVSEALAEWRRAFGVASNNWFSPGELMPYGQVRLATQQFDEQDCAESTDIAFQFGLLTEQQQKEFVADPPEVVALTVRTAYDEKLLRGRGFIYISADSGPLKPRLAGISEQRWSLGDGILLKRVLMHELGHVFGLPHFGDAGDLMGMRHPEQIVQKTTISEIIQWTGWELERKRLSRIGIFKFDERYDGYECEGFSSEVGQFFGVPDSWGCFGIKLQGAEVSFWASPDEKTPRRLIGKIAGTLSDNSSHNLINVKISPKQRVFTKIPKLDREYGYLRGPGVIQGRRINSTYRTEDGAIERSIKAVFMPGVQYEIEGVLDGRIVELLSNK